MSSNHSSIVKADNQLLISYSIRYQDRVLESSDDDAVVEYQMGAGQWPHRIEQAMLGEKAGAEIHLEIEESEGVFGRPDPERVIEMDLCDFSSEPEPGALIEFVVENGETIEGQVLSVFGDRVDVDFNHPYAGRALSIDIHIRKIL